MSDDSQTGPWALALVTLAIGIGAVVLKVWRQRREGSETPREVD